ncbi:MAG: hypothetical protein AB9921_06220 [Erysipelotrichaceae bacterium]
MGSSGRGEFGNYKVGKNGIGSSGGEDGQDGSGNGKECPTNIEGILLEDVGTCEYFKTTGSLPGVGKSIFVDSKTKDGRIVVIDLSSSMVLGNLPTRYNYLIECISVIHYVGTIGISGLKPMPHVVVEIHGK